jgi:hypothetical protein
MSTDSIADLGRSFAVDLDRTAERMRFFSDGKLHFAVYENGTCIFMKEKSRAEALCKAALDVMAASHPDFVVRDMKDGNYLVTFKDF